MPQCLHQSGTVPYASNISGGQLFHSISCRVSLQSAHAVRVVFINFPIMELLGSEEHLWS